MPIHKLFISVVFFFIASEVRSQCAMCKAVVESGDKGMAEGLNDGIVYLMIVPYLLVGVLAFALFRYMKRQKESK
ncbi:hypothetical protein ACFLRU_06430 [Bacteroidota bacterium]